MYFLSFINLQIRWKRWMKIYGFVRILKYLFTFSIVVFLFLLSYLSSQGNLK